MNRQLALADIAIRIENLITEYGRRDDISITAISGATEEDLAGFSDFQRKYLHLRDGEDYFFIWECGTERSSSLLYVVNVSCDSYLTAAGELMELVARRF